MKLGDIIRLRRRRLALSLRTLSRQVGCGKSYINLVENDKVAPPRPRIMSRIADALGLDRDALNILSFVERAPKEIRHTSAFKQLHAAALDLAVEIREQ